MLNWYFFPLSSSGNLLLELMNWVLSFSVKLRQKSQIFSSITLLFWLENDGKGNISVSYETKNIVQFKSVVYFILCSVLVGKWKELPLWIPEKKISRCFFFFFVILFNCLNFWNIHSPVDVDRIFMYCDFNSFCFVFLLGYWYKDLQQL